MQLINIKIKNYRLLIDAELDVDEKTAKEKKKADPDLDRKIRDWMCANFYDIRAFGAVMTTFMKAALNCGQVRGPVQLGFARSVEPVVPAEVSITRMAVTNEKDLEKERTMGRKFIVPYGLYRMEGFVSVPLAEKSGFADDDLDLLWEALSNMFEHDRSAARGKMGARKLFIFKHEKRMGNAPAQKLFDMVHCRRTTEGPARGFADYAVTLEGTCPEGISVEERL